MGVRRHPCQGTCRSEAMCVRQDKCRRQVCLPSSRRHVGMRRYVPKTGRTRTRTVGVVAKTRGWATRRHFPKTGRVKHASSRRPVLSRRCVGAPTGQANAPIVAKTPAMQRAPTAATARTCFELQGRSLLLQQAVRKCMPSVVHDCAAIHDFIFPRCVHARPRLKALAGCTRANPPCPQWRRKRVVANPAPAWRRPKLFSKRGVARSRVAPVAHVASGSHVVSPDVASKRDVTCPPGVVREPGGVSKLIVASNRGVRKLAGIARCGVKTWRHLPTWRQGAG